MDTTIPFINISTAWQNLHLNSDLVALGVEQGDQLVITNRSSNTLRIHEGSNVPLAASGYKEIHDGEQYVTQDFQDAWVQAVVGDCEVLVEYAP